jgi:hypothetical protein
LLNREKSDSLRKEKERLLDEVMDTETFKVAKKILEKYAPSHLLPKYLADQQSARGGLSTPLTRQGQGQDLRRRTMGGGIPGPMMMRSGFPPPGYRPQMQQQQPQFGGRPQFRAIMGAPSSTTTPGFREYSIFIFSCDLFLKKLFILFWFDFV